METNHTSFTKISASGNDFIILDNRNLSIHLMPEWIKTLCHRQGEIGADGIILIEPSQTTDFKIRIFNSDGSEAAMCGNGSMCVAMFAYIQNIASSHKMVFETLSGHVEAIITGPFVKIKLPNGTNIKLNMSIELIDSTEFYKGVFLKNQLKPIHFITIGVPHAILIVDNVDTVAVYELGRLIRWHEDFQPEGTNVDFVEIIDSHTIKIRTYERGVENETLACGTGSCASVCISHLLGRILSPCSVLTKGGETWEVFFELLNDKIINLYLQGTVHVICEGEL